MRELSLHILDLLENAVEAGASRIELKIEEDLRADGMVIEVADNGRGMSQEVMEKALDPFCTTRTTRHVGLGLPLFMEAARRCGGNLVIQSNPGKGTRVRATFRHSHIDRAPLGDLAGALMAILLSEHPVDLDFCHRIDSEVFRLDSSEIRGELGSVPLSHPKVRTWLFDVLREGEAHLADKREGRPPTP